MMGRFTIVDYGTDLHNESIQLRNRVLREPIGLIFSDQDLKNEQNAIHLAYFEENDMGRELLAGTCFLTTYDKDTIKLRQMAVDPLFRKQGVGSKLISFAEKVAKTNGFKHIYLHAREEALDFYKKQNYKLISDVFLEVGIPHYEMLKDI